jgi:hypothetical protein
MERHRPPVPIVMLGIAVACSSPTELELRERMDELQAAIVALIGDPVCESVEECRYIGFGQQACGGPWSYLVYSIAQTDSVRLKLLVDEHRRVTKEWNIKTNAVSTCGLPPVPVLARRDGRCVDVNVYAEAGATGRQRP